MLVFSYDKDDVLLVVVVVQSCIFGFFLQRAYANIDELDKEIANVRKKNKELAQSRDEKIEKLEETQTSLARSDQSKQDLKRSISKEKKNTATWKDKSGSQAKDRSSLVKKNTGPEARVASLEKSEKKLKNDVDSANEKIDSANEKIDTLTSDVDVLKTSDADKQLRINSIELCFDVRQTAHFIERALARKLAKLFGMAEDEIERLKYLSQLVIWLTENDNGGNKENSSFPHNTKELTAMDRTLRSCKEGGDSEAHHNRPKNIDEAIDYIVGCMKARGVSEQATNAVKNCRDDVEDQKKKEARRHPFRPQN